MAYIFDLIDPQSLQGFVRTILNEEEQNRFVMSQFLPNENIDEIEFRVTRGNLRDQDAAKVRAWDTESPIGNRQGIQRIMGELPPISKKIRLGEEERLRQRALERQDNSGLVDAIYNDAANMARAVAARIEMMRGEALWKGQIVINENGVNQTIDFGRSGSHSVAPGTLWSNTGASTPISDMNTWVSTYRNTNGISPAFALISTEIFNNLSLNTQIRNLAQFNGIQPAFISIDQINQVLNAHGLPSFIINDEKVRVDGTQTRIIPNDRVVFLPPANEPLGNTFLGTTAEAIELAEAQQISADQVPGMVAVIEKTFDPVATWTKAAAVALPVLVNPDLTFVADVQ